MALIIKGTIEGTELIGMLSPVFLFCFLSLILINRVVKRLNQSLRADITYHYSDADYYKPAEIKVTVLKEHKKWFRTFWQKADINVEIDKLSQETQEKITALLQEPFSEMSSFADTEGDVRDMYTSYTPYLELIMRDLWDALNRTSGEEEEKLLVENAEIAASTLAELLIPLNEEKNLQEEMQLIADDLEKKERIDAHKEDFSTTEALSQLLDSYSKKEDSR